MDSFAINWSTGRYPFEDLEKCSKSTFTPQRARPRSIAANRQNSRRITLDYSMKLFTQHQPATALLLVLFALVSLSFFTPAAAADEALSSPPIMPPADSKEQTQHFSCSDDSSLTDGTLTLSQYADLRALLCTKAALVEDKMRARDHIAAAATTSLQAAAAQRKMIEVSAPDRSSLQQHQQRVPQHRERRAKLLQAKGESKEQQRRRRLADGDNANDEAAVEYDENAPTIFHIQYHNIFFGTAIFLIVLLITSISMSK
jgi:hypothetical protein